MRKSILITGGAGFIGSSIARRLLEVGQPVLVFDSLTGTGSQRTLRDLRSTYGDLLDVLIGDIRDRNAVRGAVERASTVIHLAGQVAPTASLVDPVLDFDVNVRGTINLLEEMRRCDREAPLVYASSHKVYGEMESVPLRELGDRYQPAVPWTATYGIDEGHPIAPSGPFGCSHAAAEQYVLDYARSFGLRATALRLSCIYGRRQIGTEDQGWVPLLVGRAVQRRAITIYGNGKQVRDLLHVSDLVEAVLRVVERIDDARGHVFNVGGGPANALSLRELLDLVGERCGQPITVAYSDWRRGDQRYFAASTRKLESLTGWSPQVAATDGILSLCDWLATHLSADGAAPVPHAEPERGALREVV